MPYEATGPEAEAAGVGDQGPRVERSIRLFHGWARHKTAAGDGFERQN